jgi:ABC-2 type transport system ATP-binding protein
VLDEPTAGVDVELRQMMWEFIKRLNREGHTIILTTHYLEEAETLCSRIAMMKQGRIVALDSTANLLRKTSGRNLRLKLAAPLPEDLRPLLRHEEGQDYLLTLNDVSEIERVLATVREAGIAIEDVHLIEADLEDVFVELVGQA